MHELYLSLLKIHPDAVCIRTIDYSYGMEVCIVLPSGEEMVRGEFVRGSRTDDWFGMVEEYLDNHPDIGTGDWPEAMHLSNVCAHAIG